MRKVIRQPIGPHPNRNRLFRNREGPAESAALIRPIEIHERDAIHHLQQGPNLVLRLKLPLGARAETKPAQAVAGLMQSDPAAAGRPCRFDTHNVCEELAQLPRAL